MADDLENDFQRVQHHIRLLGEHFDSVQIFVTKTEGKDTTRIADGSGNFLARYGHCVQWVNRMDEMNRCDARDSHEKS